MRVKVKWGFLALLVLASPLFAEELHWDDGTPYRGNYNCPT